MPCERLSLGIFEIDHGLSYSREFLSALVAFRAVSSNQVSLAWPRHGFSRKGAASNLIVALDRPWSDLTPP